MHNFITNTPGKKSLKDRINTLIPISHELKFLVGFFYFSGWGELYKSLMDSPTVTLRILVGLQVDRYINNTVVEFAENAEGLSDDDRFEAFMASLGKALNSDDMDTEEFYTQVQFFLDMIKQERLVVRKTCDPNHAKLYIFKFNETQAVFQGTPGQIITGSSNLTSAGLSGQNEFNVEIRDYGFNDANAYFDELWERAAKLTEEPEKRVAITHFVEHKTLASQVSPFEAYALVLKTYLDLQQQRHITPLVEQLLENNGFKKFAYQIDAVNQALSIIKEYNGVVIADVVGLGKSVIASLIAKCLDKRTLILCPPGLVGNKYRDKPTGWWEYAYNFELNCEIDSSGNLEKVAEGIDNRNVEVVIIDEAHRFRNQDTGDYEALHKICQNKIVILLSATPFNNTPADIFSLLKLFIVPGKSGITINNDLEAMFTAFGARFNKLSYILKNHNSETDNKREKAQKLYLELFGELPLSPIKVKQATKALGAQIKSIVAPVVIRRNRLDLQNDYQYKKEATELSKVCPPTELFFELNSEQSKFYDKVLTQYFGKHGRFKGAIYRPFKYEKVVNEAKLTKEENKEQLQQDNLFDFMRRLLVKRFESSFGAFSESIDRFLNIHIRVKEFIKRTDGKYILDRKLLDKLLENADDEEIEQALADYAAGDWDGKTPKNSTVYKTKEFVKKDEFYNDVQSDIDLFTEIQKEVRNLNIVKNDPKRDKIGLEVEQLRAQNPNRKVIIFSEYVDTVEHLTPYLEKKFGSRLLVCNGVVTPLLNQQLNENFNAQYKGAKRDDFDVLVTSDKLSEGYNLNRAGVIINYDIPWNPTRVIQRIGRINRIGVKVFDELNLYNCFPTAKGGTVVSIRETAMQKMFLIHNALGEDAKVFDIDEEPTPSQLYNKVNQNPDADEEESITTSIRNKYNEIATNYPQVVERISALPHRVKSGKFFTHNQVCVLRKKGLSLFTHIADETTSEKIEAREVLFEEFLSLIECTAEEKCKPITSNFWKAYEHVKNYQPKRMPRNPQSIEYKALENLKCALKLLKHSTDEELREFIKTLIKDINEYKTLSDRTIGHISRTPIKADATPQELQKFCDVISTIQQSIGKDYLTKILDRVSQQKNEVVIAIENSK